MNDDFKAFTLRLPRELVDQIDIRAKLNHRKRSGEINALLETAIDVTVKSDLQVLKRTADLSQNEY